LHRLESIAAALKLDPSILARIQFAFTVSFHIIFPTMSIGLASFLYSAFAYWIFRGKTPERGWEA
jgi:cytochrome bd-type quinol oxidase subunit 1